MSVALQDRPVALAPGRASGGGPARRAVTRWSWRLFRREWRQQLLVLVLLIVAVAASVMGLGVVTNTPMNPSTTAVLPASDPQLTNDIAAIEQAFGPAEVIQHEKVPVPGSVATVDVRAQDTAGSHPSLQLVSGRFPSGPGEVAMTRSVAAIFNAGVGGTWSYDGRTLRIVGVVQNPQDFRDGFALVASGQLTRPQTVTVGLHVTYEKLASRHPHVAAPLQIEGVSRGAKAAAAEALLALATIALLFVGLVAVTGFTVVAQRHLRALGMLGAQGASDRHVRLVMLADGAAVGVVSAAAGALIGLAGWLLFEPRLENLAHHHINRFNLPWWAVAALVVLAFVTAVAAAWWPARAVSRVSVVAALSGRPPRPQPAHRFAVFGGALLLGGLVLLAFAYEGKPPIIVAGTLASTVGLLLLAPLAIRALAVAGRRAPIAMRLALRDLVRYQARSGAALAAITLAIAIAATIALSAAYQLANVPSTPGNLPSNELVVNISQIGGGLVPDLSPDGVQAAQAGADAIAAALGTHDVLGLDRAVNPNEPVIQGPDAQGRDPASLVQVISDNGHYGVMFVVPLYVATPELLARYGIKAGQVDPTTDVLIAPGRDVSKLRLGYGPRQTVVPKVQTVDLPKYDSDPNALITQHALQTLGLEPVAAGWLIRTPGPLTAAQIDGARRTAAAAGLTIETRFGQHSDVRFAEEATATGILLALGVLAMTVGLIRSETANDLRTLTATGASARTRRNLTAATAGALALLGALLGTGGAYLALVAAHRNHITPLGNVPVADLAVILVGLPFVAAAGGWLLAGREPHAIARRPLE